MNAQELWDEYVQAKGIDPDTEHDDWAFCGGGPDGDKLADLVIARIKFATASAYDEYVAEDALFDLPKADTYSVILKDNGDAVCVIKNYSVEICPFKDVSPFHGYAEGEGDRSLAYWRKVHTEFFTETAEELGITFTEDSNIVLEKFSVEYEAGKGLGDPDELIYVEPTMEYASEIAAYRQEMLDADSGFDGCFSLKRMPDMQEYVDYCRGWSNPNRPADKHGAWGTVLLCMRKSDMKMVGCMQVHNVLSERMRKYTGHVGYSVRPSERKKGYATQMLAKAKDFLTSFGFEEAFVSCRTDNEASRRVILANGGEYMATVFLEEENLNLEQYKLKLK